MKKLALSLSLLSIVGLSTPVLASQEPAKAPAFAEPAKCIKVGYVRMEKIMGEKSEGAVHELRDKIEVVKKDVESRQRKLQAEQEKLVKEGAELESGDKSKWQSDAARESKKDELLQRKDTLQGNVRRFQEYVQHEQQKLQAEMGAKIEKTVNAIGEKKGYDLILAFGGVYVGAQVDITDQVISALNKEYDASKAKKAAKPAAAAKK